MSVGGIVYGYYNILMNMFEPKYAYQVVSGFKLDVSDEVEGGYVRC